MSSTIDSRAQELIDLLATLERIRWRAEERLAEIGATKSQVRTMFKEFDGYMRGCILLIASGQLAEAELRLVLAWRCVKALAGEPKTAQVLQ
jgi:hypothetical protein